MIWTYVGSKGEFSLLSVEIVDLRARTVSAFQCDRNPLFFCAGNMVNAYAMQERILFDNPHFVVVDKPAGWLTVPSRWGDKDERPCLGRKLEDVVGARLWPVHRLDFEVTGLTLFAKSAEAHKRSNGWFEKRKVAKNYQAITEGISPKNLNPADRELLGASTDSEFVFNWKCKILRGKKRAYLSEHGDWAETEAHWLGEQEQNQKWLLLPKTGRPHQLRFELSRHGYPIKGDKLYGAKTAFESDEAAIALRAVSLSFSSCEGFADLGLPEVLKAQELF